MPLLSRNLFQQSLKIPSFPFNSHYREESQNVNNFLCKLNKKVTKVKVALVQTLRLCTGRTAHRGSSSTLP